MRHITVHILFVAILLQTYAKELSNSTVNAQHSVNKLFDKLFDKGLKMRSLHHADLDNMSLTDEEAALKAMDGTFMKVNKWIGTIGSAVTTFSLIPQVIKTARSRSTKDLSYVWQFAYITAGVLMNYYAVAEGLWPVYGPGLFELGLIISLTLMKVVFEKIEARKNSNAPKTSIDKSVSASINKLTDRNNLRTQTLGTTYHVPTYTGEEICEGRGFDQAQCEEHKLCCAWDGNDCWSAVGQGVCPYEPVNQHVASSSQQEFSEISPSIIDTPAVALISLLVSSGITFVVLRWHLKRMCRVTIGQSVNYQESINVKFDEL